MKIKLEDGRTLNVEGDPSPEEIDGIVSSFIQGESLPAERPMIPEDVHLPMGMTVDVIKAANKGNADFNNLVNSIRNDPEMINAYSKLEKENPFMALAQSAANVGKSFGHGAAQIADENLPESVTNAVSSFFGGDPLKERIEQRAIDMAKQNTEQKIRSVASPTSSAIGEIVPYLATDVMLSPLTGRAVGGVVKGIGKIGSGVLKGTKAAEKALKGSSQVAANQLGNIVEPARRSMENIANRPVLNAFNNAAYKELARAPLTGAIEGGLDYNQTAGEGAMNSFIGQAGSMGPLKSALGRADVKLTASEKKVLDKMISEGYRATPGMRTGSKTLQAKEQGFRSEPRFRDYMDEMDTANNKVIADQVSDAMGLPRQTAADLTPDVLSDHMKNLKKEYTDLENNTTGKYGPAQMKEAAKILKEHKPTKYRNTLPEDAADFKVVNKYVKQMRGEIGSIRTPQGMRQGFNGSQYQNIRQSIQNDISKAYNAGNNRLASSLKDIQKVLDDSLEAGMGKKTAAQWKDANERYAMTQKVIEKGMDPLGGINVNKLSEHLMADDAFRTVTSKGGRIQNLQTAVKINEIQKRQAGEPGWSGSGVDVGDTTKKGLMRSTFSTPWATRIPMTTRAGMNLYMSGYPAVTGLTGLPKPTIGKIFRANEQASQGMQGLYEDASDTMSDISSGFDKLMNAMLGQ